MYSLVFWWLIISLLIGAGGAFYAKKHAKDPVLYFLLGAVFGLFMLAFFLVLKLRKAENNK